jgi:hypothetical protein
MWPTITPAYGRDYKNKKEILADWEAGKDFTLHNGFQTTYINKQDAERDGLTKFNVRYAGHVKLTTIQLKKGQWK